VSGFGRDLARALSRLLRSPGFTLAAVTLSLLAAAGAASAQGLGAAAAREKQKRQQQTAPAPARVFTDADLSKQKPAGDGGAALAEGGEPKARAGEAAPEGAQAGTAGTGDPVLDALEKEREERKLQEAEWRVRFANAREQLALAEAACWREVVRTEFYQGVPVQMKVKEFAPSEEFRQAQRALADLEEQYRRTGLPPGWAREP
jgi:hypothetical protein